MSDEHFTVDGTLIEAWASQKSFQRKDGGTDGDGRELPRPGAEERHACLEDRPGRAVVSQVERRRVAAGVSGAPADRESPRPDCRRDGDARRTATAEREAAHADAARRSGSAAPGRRRTVGADKAYDTRDFVDLMRELGITPHVTQNLDAARAAARSTAAPRATRATR